MRPECPPVGRLGYTVAVPIVFDQEIHVHEMLDAPAPTGMSTAQEGLGDVPPPNWHRPTTIDHGTWTSIRELFQLVRPEPATVLPTGRGFGFGFISGRTSSGR